jgi:hypothetical protein
MSLQFDFIPASFDSGNVALASFPINKINKGRWMEEEHKILMQEYEKYGNNCMQIARVLSTQTPAQIKKHAECFFKQNLQTDLQQWNNIKNPSLLIKKAQVLVKMLLNNKNIDNLFHLRIKQKYYPKMLMHLGNNASHFLLRKRSKFKKIMLLYKKSNASLFLLMIKFRF